MGYQYSVTIRHPGLGKCRVITGSIEAVVDAKARAQMVQWDHQYQMKLEKDRKQSDRESKKMEEADKKQDAADRTAEAQAAIEEVKGILKATLSVNDAVDWETLKTREPFPKPEPAPPIYKDYPPEPQANAPQFQPVLTLFDKMVKSRVEAKQAEARHRYELTYAEWAALVESIKAANDQRYSDNVAAVEKWNAERSAYETKQTSQNDAVEQQKAAYLAAQPEAITDYCELVLSRSSCPDSFPKDFELEYNPETKIIVVEYQSARARTPSAHKRGQICEVQRRLHGNVPL